MFEVKALGGGSIVRVRLTGAFATPELGRLRQELLAGRPSALRLLFDWTELESWDKQPIGAACQEWEEPARLIVRAAIVHNQKWYRQAAAFGAILRTHRRDVKSWPPENIERAVSWLTDDKQ